MHHARAAIVTLAAFLCLATPSAAQDPWSKVPAFPTSCYDNATPGFVDQISNIRHELTVQADAQNDINTAIQQKVVDMDPSEKQSKMMAFMMKNPTEAGKMMQDIATAGQNANQKSEGWNQKVMDLNEQLKSAESKYATEKAALDALEAQWAKTQPEHGNAGNPGLGRQLAAKYDAQYEALCEKSLKAESSPFLKYLSNLKAFQVTEQIPGELERLRQQKRELDLYGISSTELKSTETHNAVTEYLSKMSTVFGRRRAVTMTSRSAR
jgi:hypothetical protein